MTTQNIHRTHHDSNFVILPNAILTSTNLSGNAKALLGYLLSRPAHWKVRISDLQSVIRCGRDRVYRYLRELVSAGYATMTLIQKGVRWQFFDVPQTSQTPDTATPAHLTETQQAERQQPLERNEIHLLERNEKTTTAEPLPDPVQDTKIVAASNLIEENTPTTPLTDPVIIAEVAKLPVEQKIKPSIIKTLSNISISEAKAVLAILTRAITLGKVQNPAGYCVSLVRAAQDGSLTTPVSNQPVSLAERLQRQERERQAEAKRGAMDNATWAKWFEARTGVKPVI